MPSAAENAKKRCMYMNVFAWKAQTLHIYKSISGQEKPIISDGFEVKPYTRNPFDYRRLYELVLG